MELVGRGFDDEAAEAPPMTDADEDVVAARAQAHERSTR